MCISDAHKQKKKKTPNQNFVDVSFDPLCFTSLFVGFISGMLRTWPLDGYKGLITGAQNVMKRFIFSEIYFYS